MFIYFEYYFLTSYLYGKEWLHYAGDCLHFTLEHHKQPNTISDLPVLGFTFIYFIDILEWAVETKLV